MLSWGEWGKRKWEGPGVNQAGWEAWLPAPGPLVPGCRALGFVSLSPMTECLFLGADVWPGPLACLCTGEMRSQSEDQGPG